MDLDRGTIFVGVDLAWAEGSAAKVANESGVVCIDGTGQVLDAGWTVGVAETVKRIMTLTADASCAVLFVDAPLVVTNQSRQRLCERQVGQRYGSWLVSANSTNVLTKNKAGVTLLKQLEDLGWIYDSGHAGQPCADRVISECIPGLPSSVRRNSVTAQRRIGPRTNGSREACGSPSSGLDAPPTAMSSCSVWPPLSMPIRR
jgi:hypothetical protein